MTSDSFDARRLSKAEFGSDLIVELLNDLEIPFVSLNPGSSFRGLHDSLVNFPGAPEMVVSPHEEIAIALAHGYARVTGKPLACGIHNVVGLQHASMAIYNAWCDRIPMIVLGGTGPMSTTRRRDYIDWVHTANVQGNLVRDYVKWDDQPASVDAFPESLLRAYRIAMTEPQGPVYIAYDVDLQEQAVTEPIYRPDPKRFAPPEAIAANPDAVRQAAALLAGAQFPVIVADAMGRHPSAVAALTALAQLLAAPVVSNGARFNFASNHPLNVTHSRQDAFAQADVLLALDVFDLSASLGVGIGSQRSSGALRPEAKVIHISVWDLLQHSWATDFGRLHPVDLPITADSSIALPQLIEETRRALDKDTGSARRIDDRRTAVEAMHAEGEAKAEAASKRVWTNRPISQARLQAETWESIKQQPWSLVWGAAGNGWQVTEPEQIAGSGRGAGLGQSTGAAVGSALAHKGDGRLCVAIIGDGDFLYAPSALWTAANQSVPLLTIVNNNRSYGNDEGHQEHMARTRGRPVENKGVGIFIEEPKANFAALSGSLGVEGFGPVEDPEALRGVLDRAVSIVTREQRPVLVEVITQRRT